MINMKMCKTDLYSKIMLETNVKTSNLWKLPRAFMADCSKLLILYTGKTKSIQEITNYK